MEKDTGKRLRSLKELRRFGYSFALGMAILLLVSYWRDFPVGISVTAAVLGVFHLFSALIQPDVLYPTYKLIRKIGKWAGRLLTMLVFTFVYYLLFTPLVLLLRLFKKDTISHFSREPSWLDVPEIQNNPERVEKLF